MDNAVQMNRGYENSALEVCSMAGVTRSIRCNGVERIVAIDEKGSQRTYAATPAADFKPRAAVAAPAALARVGRHAS